MRDLVRRVLPTLTWCDCANAAIAFVLLIAIGLWPEHLRDVGGAVATFLRAVWP